MFFEIEKNVPIVNKTNGGGGRPPKYPWEQMEVGDSFYVPKPDKLKNIRDLRSNLLNASRVYVRRYGWQFTTSEEGEGIRIWRIENQQINDYNTMVTREINSLRLEIASLKETFIEYSNRKSN